MPLLRFFISSRRKVDVEISILIRDLANVPLVSGLYFIKWRVKRASHSSGCTERAPIKDHCIYWNHSINTMAKLIINKQDLLGACELKLDVFQELSGGKETQFIGCLSINLTDYANMGVITRRYLLDQCKFNSTLKLSLRMNPKSEIGGHQLSPSQRAPAVTDTMNTKRRERQLQPDERSIADSVATAADHSQPLPVPRLKKSHSAMDLPDFCRQNSMYSSPDDPSPTDLVEKFFSQNRKGAPSLT